MKLKQIDLYLTNEDLEQLHSRYEELFSQVKKSAYLTPAQIDKECDVLSRKYDFEVRELSKYREAEYLERQAEIEAKNNERIPWRRNRLWRLLFLPVTNRAQDIIERQAELEAENYHRDKEEKLKAFEDLLYLAHDEKPIDLKKPSDIPTIPADDVAEPPEPPARKPRKINSNNRGSTS